MSEPDTLQGTVDDLTDATVSNANLTGATLINADLTFTDLNRADMSFASLNCAATKEETDVGTIWNHTVCPDGTNSATNGTSPEFCDGHGF